jgi:hypothetical protein
MGFYIRDDKVRALAAELASKRGCSMTQAVKSALQAELGRDEDRFEAKMRALRQIQAEIAALPELAPGFTDKDLYDENGDPIL